VSSLSWLDFKPVFCHPKSIKILLSINIKNVKFTSTFIILYFTVHTEHVSSTSRRSTTLYPHHTNDWNFQPFFVKTTECYFHAFLPFIENHDFLPLDWKIKEGIPLISSFSVNPASIEFSPAIWFFRIQRFSTSAFYSTQRSRPFSSDAQILTLGYSWKWSLIVFRSMASSWKFMLWSCSFF